MRTHLAVAVALVFSASIACSNDRAARPADTAPQDEQAEQEIVSGVTRIASKLQDPDGLTSYGDSIYFATTYGFVTQQFAHYDHDIWVKTGTGRAKRLYRQLNGASWGMVATKHGLYELNEAYASIMRYPLDGSNAEGQTIFHSTFEDPGDEMAGVGLRALVADDDGLVVALRTSYEDGVPGSVITLAPDGTNKKSLGTLQNGASALKIVGSKVYVGTTTGEVFVGNRSGSGSLTKVAAGEGVVWSIAPAGEAVFFGTDKGLFVKRAAASAAEKLLPEGTSELTVVRDQLLFGQYTKGVSSMPLSGGATKLVLKLDNPSSILSANDQVFVTNKAYGRCTDTDEGQACAFDGAAFRLRAP